MSNATIRSDADEGLLVSRVTSEQRKRLTAEHSARLARGEIDLGPAGHAGNPLPVDATAERRDMRDPNALGKRVLQHAMHGELPLAEVADLVDAGDGGTVRDYDSGELSGTRTAAKYRAELEERAARGDKFAISMLTTGKPGDSDE